VIEKRNVKTIYERKKEKMASIKPFIKKNCSFFERITPQIFMLTLINHAKLNLKVITISNECL